MGARESKAPAPTHIKPVVGIEAAVYSLKHLEEIAAETSEPSAALPEPSAN